jgi:hypothetical protein
MIVLLLSQDRLCSSGIFTAPKGLKDSAQGFNPGNHPVGDSP